MTTTQVFQLVLRVQGVKKRARKDELHHVDMYEIPDTGADFAFDSVSVGSAKAALDVHFRSWSKAWLIARPEERLDHGNGNVMRRASFFNARQKVIQILPDGSVMEVPRA